MSPAPETAPAAPEDALPSRGLLSFYDRLRERVLAAAEQRGGRAGGALAQTLVIVPDLFLLVARLSLDKEVPKSTRALLASTLAYFVLPADLLPELLLGPVGFAEDAILALAVLSQALGPDLEHYAEKHWSGPQKVRTVLRDSLRTADAVLKTPVYDRLRSLLARSGIDLDRATSADR